MEEKKFFEYKGFPLVRNGKQLLYGEVGGKTVVNMQIMSTKKIDGIDVADKIRVVHTYTEAPDGDAAKMVIKNVERGSLYEALDIAYVWLTRN